MTKKKKPPPVDTESDCLSAEEQAVNYLFLMYSSALEKVQKFQREVATAEPPFQMQRVLEWSRDPAHSAALLTAIGHVLRHIWTNESDLSEKLCRLEMLHNLSIVRLLKYGFSNSTSPMSNFMKECEAAAEAEVYEVLRPFRRQEDPK